MFLDVSVTTALFTLGYLQDIVPNMSPEKVRPLEHQFTAIPSIQLLWGNEVEVQP